MSPPAFRATFPGVAYQLGNVRSSLALTLCFTPSTTYPYSLILQMVSSASAQIAKGRVKARTLVDDMGAAMGAGAAILHKLKARWKKPADRVLGPVVCATRFVEG